MANIASAKKRARQTLKRRLHNASARSNLRTHIKRVLAAIQAGNKEEAQSAFATAVSVIDKAASKGLVHKNKAARQKSRLSTKIKGLAA